MDNLYAVIEVMFNESTGERLYVSNNTLGVYPTYDGAVDAINRTFMHRGRFMYTMNGMYYEIFQLEPVHKKFEKSNEFKMQKLFHESLKRSTKGS